MRVIIEAEPKEIAAIVLAVQERQNKNVDVTKLAKSVVEEINRRTLESGKSVLLI